MRGVLAIHGCGRLCVLPADHAGLRMLSRILDKSWRGSSSSRRNTLRAPMMDESSNCMSMAPLNTNELLGAGGCASR